MSYFVWLLKLVNNYQTTSKEIRVVVSADRQWLQFDVGPPTVVTGIVTRGRGDGTKKTWVVRFRLSYSNDSSVWHFYKDASHHQNAKV